MSKTKHGLGKGLSALIGRPSATGSETVAIPELSPRPRSEGEIARIELSKIRPNPYQPRTHFDSGSLDELKESIREKGIIQPVTVRRTNEGIYELISGERRIRASQELGLTTVPAYILDIKKDEEMLELALVENLQREHLNPVEIAISYQRLISEVGLSPDDVAKKISKDRTTVVNFLRLLKLPDRILQAVRQGQISAGHARALVSLPDDGTQTRIFERIIKSDLNVRQVEKLVQRAGKKPGRTLIPIGKTGESAVGTLEEKMQHALGTKVRVDVREGGKGGIIIEFYSNDDLGRLYDLITSIVQ